VCFGNFIDELHFYYRVWYQYATFHVDPFVLFYLMMLPVDSSCCFQRWLCLENHNLQEAQQTKLIFIVGSGWMKMADELLRVFCGCFWKLFFFILCWYWNYNLSLNFLFSLQKQWWWGTNAVKHEFGNNLNFTASPKQRVSWGFMVSLTLEFLLQELALLACKRAGSLQWRYVLPNRLCASSV